MGGCCAFTCSDSFPIDFTGAIYSLFSGLLLLVERKMEKCKGHGQPRLIGACEWQRLAHVTGTRVSAMAAQSGENQNAK